MQHHNSCSIFFKTFTAIHLLFFNINPREGKDFCFPCIQKHTATFEQSLHTCWISECRDSFSNSCAIISFYASFFLFLSSEIVMCHFSNLNIRWILLIIKLKFNTNFIAGDILTITNTTFLLKYKHNLHLFNKYIMHGSR